MVGKFVKFHLRIIDCHNGHACGITKFIQAGITDITEIVILKKLLYGTSEALKRADETSNSEYRAAEGLRTKPSPIPVR
jgi:hypothetical protein